MGDISRSHFISRRGFALAWYENAGSENSGWRHDDEFMMADIELLAKVWAVGEFHGTMMEAVRHGWETHASPQRRAIAQHPQ